MLPRRRRSPLLLEGEGNAGDDTFQVRHHVGVADAHDRVAFAFEKSRPRRIRLGLERMLVAVDLDDQLVRKTQHIRVERADRRLMPPFEFGKRLPQRAEQPPFRLACVASQVAGAAHRAAGLAMIEAHRPHPSAAAPLPPSPDGRGIVPLSHREREGPPPPGGAGGARRGSDGRVRARAGHLTGTPSIRHSPCSRPA